MVLAFRVRAHGDCVRAIIVVFNIFTSKRCDRILRVRAADQRERHIGRTRVVAATMDLVCVLVADGDSAIHTVWIVVRITATGDLETEPVLLARCGINPIQLRVRWVAVHCFLNRAEHELVDGSIDIATEC